jgi:soluble lytic murein transglycosylase-like protein
MSSPLHDAVQAIAAAQGIDPALLEAVALVESGGRADAFRWESQFYRLYIQGRTTAASAFGPLAACSFGPVQILLETACELGFRDQPWTLFQMSTGLAWGAKYLKTLLDWAGGDVDKACSAYNGGKGMAEHGPPYANQTYLDRVHRALKGL